MRPRRTVAKQILRKRRLRHLGRLMLWLAPLAAAGCSTWVEVRPLATGRADVEAFELRGPDLTLLRREVLRRCPQGAEVLRQAARDQQAAAHDDSRIARWAVRAAAWVDPPQREAQMMVLCKPSPDGAALAQARPADDAAPGAHIAPAPVADKNPAVLPTGPITAEW